MGQRREVGATEWARGSRGSQGQRGRKACERLLSRMVRKGKGGGEVAESEERPKNSELTFKKKRKKVSFCMKEALHGAKGTVTALSPE